MPYSYVKYVGNGTTTTYAVTFPYLDKTHIEVYVDEVLKAVGVNYNWSTPNAITFTSAPADKAVIELRRKSHQESRLVDYQDGSTLTQEIMDLDGNQVFYMAQESIDRSDVVIAKAQEAIDAKNLAKQYAEWAYKYERLAYDHMEESSDFRDQAQIYKELAESAADQTKTAATTIENARAEVATNKGIVEAAKSDVLIAKGIVDSQANLASVILTNAQTAATQAESIATEALSTATTVQTIATNLETTTATVAAQQTAALAAKTAAETARDAAISAKTSAETAASTATTKADLATTKASDASGYATTATTQAGIATTKANEASTSATSAATAKTAAEAARDAAQGYAASIDVSNKADLSYVNTQLGLKANTSSLATVATSGSYTDLTNKPTLFSGAYTDLTGKPTLFSGSYTDLTDKPTIPTVPTTVSSFTNDSGYITSSALSPYLTTSTASSTYQTQSGMSSYLTTSSAGSTYLGLAGGALTGGLREAKVAMAANDISCTAGNYFTKTISTATTLTVSNVPTTGTAASFLLDLTNGGAGTITWWSGVKWAAGTAPTLTASGRDVLGFFTHDGGTTWSGLVLAKDIK